MNKEHEWVPNLHLLCLTNPPLPLRHPPLKDAHAIWSEAEAQCPFQELRFSLRHRTWSQWCWGR